MDDKRVSFSILDNLNEIITDITRKVMNINDSD